MLLISSITVLLGGMMFQSQAYSKNQIQYKILVYVIAGVIVCSTFGVVFMLGFEVFRSVRYANFMIKIRKAELQIKKIEHHIIQASTVSDEKALKKVKAIADSGLEPRRQLTAIERLQLIIRAVAHTGVAQCTSCKGKVQHRRKARKTPKVKKYFGKSIAELQESIKTGAVSNREGMNGHLRVSFQSATSFSKLHGEFEAQNPLHSMVGSPTSNSSNSSMGTDSSDGLFTRVRTVTAKSDGDRPAEDQWVMFPSNEEDIEHLPNPIFIRSPNSASSSQALKSSQQNSRTSMIAPSAQRAIETAKTEAAQALERAKLAEAQREEVEAELSRQRSNRSDRSASVVEAQVEARVQAELQERAKDAEKQRQAAIEAQQRVEELEAKTRALEQRAAEAEQRVQEAEQSSERERREMKKLMSFRGNVASKAQLFAKRRSTRLERICKHAGQCGCTGFVTDIKAASFGSCVCGHSNSEHLQTSSTRRSRTARQLLGNTKKDPTRDLLEYGGPARRTFWSMGGF
jgi:hypothetical protein